MNLNVRQVETDLDYAESVRLRNLIFRHHPVTVAESKAMDDAYPEGKFWARYLAWSDSGTALARLNVREESSAEGPLFYCDTWVFDPLGVDEWISLHKFTESVALERGEGTLMAFAFSYEDVKIAGLEASGYVLKQINPQSEILLDEIDVPRFQSYIDAVKGVEIVPVSEYIRRDPDNWQREFWRLDMDVSYDIPMPMPFKEMPFEDYKGFLDDPNVNFSTRFMALANGKPVGISELQPNQVDPTLGSTFLTGVRKEYRRRGLASALKASALLNAKRLGVKRIVADNEESNPMYQLNLSLGFKHSIDWQFYRKQLTN